MYVAVGAGGKRESPTCASRLEGDAADPKVREALGDLAGARLALTSEVEELNGPVEVAGPPAQAEGADL